MEFSNAADELYAVEPDDFVETRTRLVRRAEDAGDAALAERIGGLRRPTLSAWAVNRLARSAAGDLGELLDVGDGLRAAWGSGGGLGDLEERRARLVGDLLQAAGALAEESGHPLRDRAVREVEDTLQAATVDAGIAAEVREGVLTRPRSHTGFVPAGFPLAPDAGEPRTGPRRKGPEGRRAAPAEEREPPRRAGKKESAAAARRAQRAREHVAETERELAERAERAASARDAAERASAEVGRLRRALERAESDRDAAAWKAERAEQARDRADSAVRRAREAAQGR